MNHQPFEAWILEDQEITQDQKINLDQHLVGCSDCAKLARSWTAAKHEIKSSAVVSAPEGFSQRWQSSLEARRKLQERQQARIMLTSLVSTALAIFITLGILLLPDISPITVMVSFLSGLIKIVNSISQLWIFMSSFLRAAPTSMLIGLGLALSIWISLTSLAWGISLWRITLKGIKTTK